MMGRGQVIKFCEHERFDIDRWSATELYFNFYELWIVSWGQIMSVSHSTTGEMDCDLQVVLAANQPIKPTVFAIQFS